MKFHKTFKKNDKLYAVYYFDNSEVVEAIAEVNNAKDAKKKVWNGEYYGFGTHGIMARKGFVKDSKFVKELYLYYENGELAQHTQIDDEHKITGKHIEYFENGNVKIEGQLESDQRVGKWIYYYQDGNIWETAEWKDNKLNGEYCRHFNNGQLSDRGIRKDDVAVGVWEQYFVNGDLKFKVEHTINDKEETETETLESKGNLEYIKSLI